MTVKEYLEQATRLDERILEEKRTCQELRELAQSLRSPSLQGRVDGSSSNEAPFVKELEKLDREEKRLQEDIKQMVALKLQINQVLRQVKKPERRCALRMRYLQGKTIAETATSIGFSEPSTWRIIAQAISEIKLPADAINLVE